MAVKKPKRMFRNRQLPDQSHDRRRVDYVGPATCEPPDLSSVLDLSKHVVICAFHHHIEHDTQTALRGLEELGVRVDYCKGASAIDAARSKLASDALVSGMDSFLFVDADVVFDPADAIRLLLSDAPVIAGLYAAKVTGKRGKLTADFMPGTTSVTLGQDATEPIQVRRVSAGFLRVKCDVLRGMIGQLDLPYCKINDGEGWPFFLPMVADGRYLAEDYAFCQRCFEAGISIFVDPSFRLYHLGDYLFGWEEAIGHYIPRLKNLEVNFDQPDAT